MSRILFAFVSALALGGCLLMYDTPTFLDDDPLNVDDEEEEEECVDADCSPYVCGYSGRCRTDCITDSDCFRGYFCCDSIAIYDDLCDDYERDRCLPD